MSKFTRALRWSFFGAGPGDTLKAILRFMQSMRWLLAGAAVLTAKADLRWEVWVGLFVGAVVTDFVWIWIVTVTAPPTYTLH